MCRILLAFILALFSTIAVAQTKDTPTFQIDGSGATRCVYVWDPNNTTATDKGLPFGCIDGKGAWNLPPGLRNARTITETDLRGYGYVGDGTSRPLSGITILNGRNTAGWTLPQWQAILPGAKALTDNIDEAAIASAVAAATGDLTINLGPGSIVLTRPLQLCGKAVIIQGAGLLSYNATTKITVKHGGNGIEHCAGAPQPDRVEIRNVFLYLDPAYQSVTSTAWALVDSKANWTRLDNVRVDGFNNCLKFTDPQGTLLTRVQCYNPDPGGTNGTWSNTGTGFYYEGTAAFENKVYDSGNHGFRTAYFLKSLVAGKPAGTIGLEDFTIQNSGCGHNQDCIIVTSDDRSYGGLFFKFDGLSAESSRQFIQMRGGTQVTVKNSLFLIYKPRPGSTWVGGGDLIEFGGDVGVSGQNDLDTTSIRIKDNNIFCSDGAGCTVNSVFRFNSRTSDVTVGDNQIGLTNLTVSKAFFYLSNYHNASLDYQFWMRPNTITEYGTKWRTPAARFIPPSNAYDDTEVISAGGFPISSTERAYTYYDFEIFKRGLTTTSYALCGTGSTLSPGSSNSSGTVNDQGPTAGPATCTINFAAPQWNMVPRCIVQSANGSIPVTIVSVSQSQLIYSRANGPIAVNYQCFSP
ncbi:hypothetical protein ACN6KF_001434 [Labrys sp. La1]|uniref:hypothetical protein n=1 Tax=Labrys sp. La1 TaxID=3404917 RepID=UPI003EC151C0